MNKFRRSKVYCAIVIAMNLAGLGEASAADSVGPGHGNNLTLDGNLTGFKSDGTAGFKPLSTDGPGTATNAVIDAKTIGVFSSTHNSVFFSFSNFVIDQGNSATFTCSAGGCAGTNNVISRVVGNPAEI